jgi:hypothetical protein
MSITNTYTYLLQATKEGTFVIPKASVMVDNQSYQSNTVTIRVDPGGGQGGQGQPAPGSGSRQQPAPGNQAGGDDVFVKAYVDNDHPYQGEEITVTYKIFTRVPISQISISKPSSFQGFWSYNLLRDDEKFNQYNQVINGVQYVVADIRKIALFPLKSGKLEIDPLEVECIAQVKRQSAPRTGDPFFDDFFNNSFFSSSYATVERALRANPLTVQVKSLPPQNRPADFTGAVGQFSFRSEIDKTRIKTNEPITLKFIVAGNGNIQLIDKLNVAFPPDFETYDPKVTSDIRPTPSGVTGTKIFEYLVIPRKPGDFSVKPVTFSYFDLSKQTYITVESPEYRIVVEKGAGESVAPVYSGVSKEEIQYIGSDIRHIESKPFVLDRTGNNFFGSLTYFLLLVVPFILFIVAALVMKKEADRRRNVMLMKNRKATKVARKRLRRAEQCLKEKNQDAFFEEISQALWGYLSDKFSIPLSTLSMSTVEEALKNKLIPEEIIRQFTDTLNDTEFARFAPGDKTFRMDEIYAKALEIIMNTERELK